MLSIRGLLILFLSSTFCSSAPLPISIKRDFDFVSSYTNSSDESLLKLELHPKRISRGVYGFDGVVKINFDIEKDDDNMFEAQVYYSANGNSEYDPLPFRLKKQHAFEFLNGYYKNILMDTLTKCSDAPKFVGEFQPPLHKKEYKFERCMLSRENLPPLLPAGYYKVLFKSSGKANLLVEAIVRFKDDS